MTDNAAVTHHQAVAHAAGHDYVSGSPHLKHPAVHRRVASACEGLVSAVQSAAGRCRVLEIGAGHGVFTEYFTRMGAEVWVTEMSGDSVRFLRERYAGDERVHVVHDPDGTACHSGPEVDVVVCVSVLHHIPDYLGVLRALLDRIAPGGAFVCYQDPLWYPTRGAAAMVADRGAYALWRLTQGNVLRGAATVARRVRGKYDERNPSDMVEYHVVREGVAETAVFDLVAGRFNECVMDRYWSTQSRVLQRLGERFSHRIRSASSRWTRSARRDRREAPQRHGQLAATARRGSGCRQRPSTPASSPTGVATRKRTMIAGASVPTVIHPMCRLRLWAVRRQVASGLGRVPATTSPVS